MRISTISWTGVLAVAVTAGVVSVSASGAARADDIAAFFKGKQVVLTISSAVGGGYDRYARTLARHMGRHIPGEPSILPKNLPGAGGIKAANMLYNQASKDGLNLGFLQATVLFEPLMGNKQALFDITKINWIGSTNSEVAMTVVWHTAPVKTLEDLRKTEIVVGATGAASTPAFYGRLQNALLGTKLKIISGYKSQTTAFHAMEQGEIQGFPSAFWSSVKSGFPQMLADKKLRILVQIALDKHPELPDVPLAQDFAKDAESRDLFKLAAAPLAIGRPTLAPPGVPADRIAALRKAFAATMTDSGYLKDAGRQRLETGNWVPAAKIEAILKDSYNYAPQVVARLAAINKELQALKKQERDQQKKSKKAKAN